MSSSSRAQSPSQAPLHRIAKLLARAGVASRREIERMIEEGRVALNGAPVETPATLLPSLDGVTVDGNSVAAPEAARLFLFHKPTGVLTTERDPQGRATIYDRLPKGLPRLMPVGRLDLNTEGLLLMTTDGGLKRQLELPATGVERAYRARAYGKVSQPQLEELIHGVEIEGVRYGSIDANIERRTGANLWIELILKEGKNREVRRVLEHLGLQVSRLIRTRYGPFVLGDLSPGQIGEVRHHDVEAFQADPTRRELPQPARRRGVAPVASEAPRDVEGPPAGARFAPGGGRGTVGEAAKGQRSAGKGRLKPAKGPRQRADGSLAVRDGGGRTERSRSFRQDRGDEAPASAGRAGRIVRGDRPARPARAGDATRIDRSDRSANSMRSGDAARSDRPARSEAARSGGSGSFDKPDRPGGGARPRGPGRAGAPGRRDGAPRPPRPTKPRGTR